MSSFKAPARKAEIKNADNIKLWPGYGGTWNSHTYLVRIQNSIGTLEKCLATLINIDLPYDPKFHLGMSPRDMKTCPQKLYINHNSFIHNSPNWKPKYPSTGV